MSFFRRDHADWLVVGLGNPGSRYAGTRHNVGFEVVSLLAERWDAPRWKDKFRGRFTVARVSPGGPAVALLQPLTYMNESGNSAGPARGALQLALEHVLVVHDEIDLPFGRIESRLGGGLAGHNGLKSLKQGLGGPDFQRIRVGVGRPGSTDPEVVSAHVLGKFTESANDVRELIEQAASEAERVVTA